jgi:hypothetical protein
MEEHFLKDFVSGSSRSTTHEPWYNRDGDCIIYQTADEAVIAERIDDVLTIYVSAVSKKAIGFQIKGVAALMKKFGLAIECEFEEKDQELIMVSLSALLLTAYEDGPKTIGRRKGYIDAFESSPRQTSLKILPSDFLIH